MTTLVELFVDNLDGDLAKRRREIVDLRLMVSASAGDRLSLVARACHVMAYAHWEGFVRNSLRSYLGLVLSQRPRVGSLQLELQALALKNDFRMANDGIANIGQICDLLERVDSRQAEVFTLDPEEVIRAGNLTSKMLKTLLSCVGLDFLPTYELRENYIDEIICGRRHRIAHGLWQPISREDAREVAASVLELCTEFNDQLQTAAVYEEYRL